MRVTPMTEMWARSEHQRLVRLIGKGERAVSLQRGVIQALDEAMACVDALPGAGGRRNQLAQLARASGRLAVADRLLLELTAQGGAYSEDASSQRERISRLADVIWQLTERIRVEGDQA